MTHWRRCNAWRTSAKSPSSSYTTPTNAPKSSDVFEIVSGTSGLIGVVDSLLVLQRRRETTLAPCQCPAAKSKTKPSHSASPMAGGAQHPKACQPSC